MTYLQTVMLLLLMRLQAKQISFIFTYPFMPHSRLHSALEIIYGYERQTAPNMQVRPLWFSYLSTNDVIF